MYGKKLLKYTVLVALMLILGTGSSFAQEESNEQLQDKAEPDVLEEIEKRTDQVHGIVTNIKEITDLMNDSDQCTECEQSQKQSQTFQNSLLAAGIGIVGTISAVFGILNYRKKFTGLDGLISAINKITGDGRDGILSELGKIKESLDNLSPDNDDEEQIVKDLKEKITSLDNSINELIKKLDDMSQKKTAGSQMSMGE